MKVSRRHQRSVKVSRGRDLQRAVAVVRLVDHQVGSLDVQDGFVSGQRRQVLVADDAVLHPGLQRHTGSEFRDARGHFKVA